MTVLTTDNRRAYTGDGSTSVYPFPVRFLSDADVKVAQRVNDEEVLLTIGTDYSVSGAGEAAGGSVTFASPPAAGVPIVIYNDPPMTQDVDYQEDDEFPANTHERALDKLTILVQRLAGRLSRALLYDETADSVLTASQVLGRVGDAETARDQAQAAQVASESAKTDAEAARDAAQATAASVDGPTLQAGIDANAVAIDQLESDKAPLASPTFTGTPTVPLPDGLNGSQIATVDYVSANGPEVSTLDIMLMQTQISDTRGTQVFYSDGYADSFDLPTSLDVGNSANAIHNTSTDLIQLAFPVNEIPAFTAGQTANGGFQLSSYGAFSEPSYPMSGPVEEPDDGWYTNTTANAHWQIDAGSSLPWTKIVVSLIANQADNWRIDAANSTSGPWTNIHTGPAWGGLYSEEFDVSGIGNQRYFRITFPNPGNGSTHVNKFELYGQPQTTSTAVLEAATAASAPSTISVMAAIEPGTAASLLLNTDIVFLASRDDGVTYSVLTMAQAGQLADGTLFVEGDVDVSGQPSGVAIVVKVNTANSKDVALKDIVVRWS